MSKFTVPAMMRAVAISKPGPAEVLHAVERAVPQPRDHEVLIRVAAAGVNRPDILQRLGLYPLPLDADPLPGLEVAGEVVALGSGVSRWVVGDKVMALTHGGGYAEYCRAHEGHCLRVPGSLSMLEAAALPETFFTVHYNVFMRAAMRAGETLLVHGGSSGIGTTAIQMAKAVGGQVIATAGSAKKCSFCEDLGADAAINYKTEDWAAAVKDFTNGRGVDVVLDMVAGSYVQKNLDCLAKDGRYSIIAFLQGPVAEVNLRPILGMRLTLTGSTLRPQSVDEKEAIANDLIARFGEGIETGDIRPIIDSSFPLDDAAKAHQLMESSTHMGKIVLEV
jgi:NADPH2:quinone reductase